METDFRIYVSREVWLLFFPPFNGNNCKMQVPFIGLQYKQMHYIK